MKADNLISALEAHAASLNARFHMPGHGGHGLRTALDSAFRLDFTESAYTDDLHANLPGGQFEALYGLCGELYPNRGVLLSCGGSTALLHTAVIAIMREYPSINTVICDRHVHFSVINALAYNDVRVIWFDGGAETLENAAKTLPPSSALVITVSPDYYGGLRDVGAMAKASMRHDFRFIVDAAHGAHLDFYRHNGVIGALSPSAYLSLGVDAVVQSLHKTLPAMTSAAILQLSPGMPRDKFTRAVKRFESSSPSFVIAASADGCLRYMKENGETALRGLYGRLTAAKRKIKDAGWTLPPESDARDPFRLCLTPPGGDGGDAFAYLFNSGVGCEFTDGETVVLIPSVLHGDAEFDALTDACAGYSPPAAKSLVTRAENTSARAGEPPYPETAATIYETYRRPSETVPLAELTGRIAAEPVYRYPPGVCAVVPGEIFDEAAVEFMKAAGITEAEVSV